MVKNMDDWGPGWVGCQHDGAMNPARRASAWLATQLGIGLLWISLLVGSVETTTVMARAPHQVALMLVLAGWLPSVPLALWQVRHRRWRSLLLSDLLGAGLLVLVACTLYLPLFFVQVIWFIPLALLPRGSIPECVIQVVGKRKRTNNNGG